MERQRRKERLFSFSETYGHLHTTPGPYLVTGQVQNDSGAYALIVEHVARSHGIIPHQNSSPL